MALLLTIIHGLALVTLAHGHGPILSFSKKFGNNNIKILAGTEAISNYNREVSGESNGFFVFDADYISFLQNGAVNRSSNSFSGRSTLYSLISSIDYGLNDKFFLRGTLRRDGSSVFSPQTRYGWFPSIGAAYVIMNENFLRKFRWLTNLKIRASWGI